MITRISKISRLPKPIREELNSRLENGQKVRTIEHWLNSLPETKATMAEHFPGRPITHQNVSDWRRTGYQDWLQHQDRLQWFLRLAEQDVELDQQNRTGDPFETMGALFLYDIGQALTALQHIKDPQARFDRLQTLTREFARLQNAFNWSRRTQLEFDKFAATRGRPAVPTLFAPKPVAQSPGALASRRQADEPTDAKPAPEKCEEITKAGGASPSASTVLASRPLGDDVKSLKNPSPPTLDPLSAVASAKADLPLSDNNSQTLKPSNSLTPKECQPWPAPAAPTPHHPPLNSQPLISQPTPPPIRRPGYDDPRPPIRGRRFVCLEG